MIKNFLLAAVMTLGLSVGCKDETTPTKPAAPGTPATPRPAPGGGAMGSAAPNMIDGKPADNSADVMAKEADPLLTQARRYITENKLDDASKVIEKLKAMRDKLPADYQSKVDEIAKMFDSAKAAVGSLPTTLPSLGR